MHTTSLRREDRVAARAGGRLPTTPRVARSLGVQRLHLANRIPTSIESMVGPQLAHAGHPRITAERPLGGLGVDAQPVSCLCSHPGKPVCCAPRWELTMSRTPRRRSVAERASPVAIEQALHLSQVLVRHVLDRLPVHTSQPRKSFCVLANPPATICSRIYSNLRFSEAVESGSKSPALDFLPPSSGSEQKSVHPRCVAPLPVRGLPHRCRVPVAVTTNALASPVPHLSRVSTLQSFKIASDGRPRPSIRRASRDVDPAGFTEPPIHPPRCPTKCAFRRSGSFAEPEQ